MESSKLVFVSLRGMKPKRKVAISLSEQSTWETFTAQVQKKLRIAGVDGVWYAQGGGRVSDISQLQDIDELEVDEVVVRARAPEDVAENGGTASSPSNGSVPMHNETALRKMSSPERGQASLPPARARVTDMDDAAKKYAIRGTLTERLAKRFLPAWARAPLLPSVTPGSESAGGETRGRRKKQKRTVYSTLWMLVKFALSILVIIVIFNIYSVQSEEYQRTHPKPTKKRVNVMDNLAFATIEEARNDPAVTVPQKKEETGQASGMGSTDETQGASTPSHFPVSMVR